MSSQTMVVRERAQDRYVSQYTELVRRVRESGLLRRRYGYYWTCMSLLVLALAGACVLIVLLGDSWLQLIMAGVLAIIFARLSFLGHDAAHRQIFKSGPANEWAGLIHGTLLSGLSLGWWQNKHNRHHANPNKIGKDPDVEPGIVAFTAEARARRHGISKFLADRQGWFFFPLLLLEGLHLHVRSIQDIAQRPRRKRRGWEIAFLAVRHSAYLTGLFLVMSPGKAVAFLAIQLGVYGLYLGSAFAPNHIAMPTVPANMNIDFLRRQVLMSRNVYGGRTIHFAMGGLNFQIEHHLFPNVPRPNLRRLQPMVRQVCEQNGIAYTQMNIFTAYKVIVRYLNNVGLAGRSAFECPLAAQLRAPI